MKPTFKQYLAELDVGSAAQTLTPSQDQMRQQAQMGDAQRIQQKKQELQQMRSGGNDEEKQDPQLSAVNQQIAAAQDRLATLLQKKQTMLKQKQQQAGQQNNQQGQQAQPGQANPAAPVTPASN